MNVPSLPASQRRQNAPNFKLCARNTPLVSLTRLSRKKKQRRRQKIIYKSATYYFFFRRMRGRRRKEDAARREDCTRIKGLVRNINISPRTTKTTRNKSDANFVSNEKQSGELHVGRVRMHRAPTFQGFLEREFLDLAVEPNVSVRDAQPCKNPHKILSYCRRHNKIPSASDSFDCCCSRRARGLLLSMCVHCAIPTKQKFMQSLYMLKEHFVVIVSSRDYVRIRFGLVYAFPSQYSRCFYDSNAVVKALPCFFFCLQL